MAQVEQAVADQLQKGQDVFLDIDVQGAAIISEDPDFDPVSIFVAPPTLWPNLNTDYEAEAQILKKRLRLRLENAAKELAEVSQYQFLVVNDDLNDAVLVMESIIIARAKSYQPFTRRDSYQPGNR